MRLTQAQYASLLARRRPADAPASEGVSDEAELHKHIIDECGRRGWIAFRGSMAHRTFRVPGEPDFIICADKGRFYLIECKTRTGKLSTDQRAISAWAEKLGHKIHVVRSFDEFIQITERWIDTGP